MRKKGKITITALIALLLVGLAWQILRAQSYRLIQGKTEAEWIKSITYRGESAETDQWRALGPQGIEMLVKALNAGNGPLESRYARIWPSLPDFLRHWLPVPVNSYSTRMCAINMLERLGPDAKSAIPEMVKALKREKTSGVRLSIIDCFSYERGLLRGRDREKNELLPEFIAAMQSPEWALRNNAALALAEYPERADVVVPVLMKTLNDSSVEVRMMAAKALHLVAPQTAAKPEVVEVIIGILKNPNDQIAYQAAQLLGDIGNAASAAIPALTESIHGTNRLVASTAERALKKIDPQAAAKAGVK